MLDSGRWLAAAREGYFDPAVATPVTRCSLPCEDAALAMEMISDKRTSPENLADSALLW
jgi:hypothetical protein